MRPALKFLIPFVIGAAIPGGLWAYTALQGRGDRDEMADDLAECRKVAGTVKETEGKASSATAELTSCRRELDGLKANSKAGTWFCALPDDKGSACFATRAECEAQATACREQSFAVCAGEGRCFSDVWGCVKQAPAGQACETRR
jgi:hypothetical protein